MLTVDSFRDLSELQALAPARYPFLLESVASGQPHARYDILFAFPGITLELGRNHALSLDQASLDGYSGQFLDAFDALWQEHRKSSTDGPTDLPFNGGWFIYLGYELAAEIEPSLQLYPDDSLPVAMATRIPAAMIRDHQTRQIHLVSESDDTEQLDQMQRDLEHSVSENANIGSVTNIKEDQPQEFLDGVARIKNYIREGDVFQVNLSRGWQAKVGQGSTHALYRSLRQTNPGPFAGHAILSSSTSIISSSPERLVAVRSGHVSTRPIAGTYPRGATAEQDKVLSDSLVQHPKEKAEHIMLIDLERNDLGRICRPGSITVNELMTVETYRHVHHIVSEVSGELCKGVTPADVIRAVFPGGTITGCPKVRCMEIIAELEQTARGAYTGSMGYINHNGDMDLNILIRTAVLHGGQLRFRAGAGIVHDSIPERELEETRHKAQGLLRSLDP